MTRKVGQLVGTQWTESTIPGSMSIVWDGDGEKIRAYLGADTEDSRYRIRLAEMEGCGDVIYVEIWPKGDGETYLNNFGENSERIELRTGPCVP